MNPEFAERSYTKEEEKFARDIGYFVFEKHKKDIHEAIHELSSYDIKDIRYQDDYLHILLGRPGLIIGAKGENITKLIEYLKCKINIVESKRKLKNLLICFTYTGYDMDMDMDLNM